MVRRYAYLSAEHLALYADRLDASRVVENPTDPDFSTRRDAACGEGTKTHLLPPHFPRRDGPERLHEKIDQHGPFNTVRNEESAPPFLELALEQFPDLKRASKIFFVDRWLAAFLGGQPSQDAVTTTKRFLREARLDPALR